MPRCMWPACDLDPMSAIEARPKGIGVDRVRLWRLAVVGTIGEINVAHVFAPSIPGRLGSHFAYRCNVSSALAQASCERLSLLVSLG